MNALKKALVLYADHTYLVLFAPGDSVPARTSIPFPLEARRQHTFRLTLGQMPGLTFDEAEFEELFSLDIEDLPPSGNGMVEVQLELTIEADRTLFAALFFSTSEQQHFAMPMYPMHGPLPLD